jgi:hypothetical protein
MLLPPAALYRHRVALLVSGIVAAKRNVVVIPLRVDLVDVRACVRSSRAANDHRGGGWTSEELKVRKRESAR